MAEFFWEQTTIIIILLVFGRADLSCNIREYGELMDVFKTIYIDPSNIFSTSVYEKYSTLVLKNIQGNFSYIWKITGTLRDSPSHVSFIIYLFYGNIS